MIIYEQGTVVLEHDGVDAAVWIRQRGGTHWAPGFGVVVGLALGDASLSAAAKQLDG